MSASPENVIPRKLDVDAIRADFPILHQEINGHPLAYLDNAASSQRPRQVIDAVSEYYVRDHANVHRGVHTLSQRATEAFEGARSKVRAFINASSDREVIWTRGTTEAINLVAQSWARPRLGAGDEILISLMEHHANIVPWQMVCEQTGARLVVTPIDECGQLRMDEYERRLGPRTRLVAVGHVSNALGTVNPVRDIIRMARAMEVPVLLDGAQAVPHMAVDVRELDCDFYAFSGHKMCGPTGIGVLYGREALLEEMPPWQGGGDMILAVSFDGTIYNDLPWKFEAGTPNIAGAVGMGAAVDYLGSVGMEAIYTREAQLLDHATETLSRIPGLRIIGTAEEKAAVVSFILEGVHPHDIGTIVDAEGVAVRTGHHCAMPVMDYFGVPATARASYSFYNTEEETERLAAALYKAREMFA
ncbi:MAG: cysteine sulfinate desulfinase [Gammaproteobacteria bacterium SG8_31]|jgi:cysteine desulfurase/selenocysteine lyase|nr:MAG: cysteine sulfinate desulfinase [Gammaproteobacteria bacterium SG8_31]